MKKLICYLGLFVFFPFFRTPAQDNNGFGVKFSGYVNWTAIYDSRQSVNAREGHFLLYPKEELPDPKGNDINAASNFNMAVIMSRLAAKITAPEFLNAKTSGLIEAEFMGNSDNDVNGLRIRHAYLNLDWGSTSLLLGQYWNPMFIPESFPDQIGSNGGAPFQPFARNPQVRLTALYNKFKFIAALMTERDFTSYGPNGSSAEYMRNSAHPAGHVQLQFIENNFMAGAGAEVKSIRPALKTKTGYENDNRLSSFGIMGFAKAASGLFKFKLQGIYGGNLADLTMLGGYAVTSVDSITLSESYTPTKTFSVWSEAAYGTPLEFGVMAGYTKNLGAGENVKGNYYARGSNIDMIYRIAPRLIYTEGKIKAGLEFEYTAAAYGINDAKGMVTNSKLVPMYRIYTSVYYYF